MRKIFILAAVLLILSFPVGASAEDVTAEITEPQTSVETVIETAAETAELATEAEDTTAVESAADTGNAAETATEAVTEAATEEITEDEETETDDLAGLLDVATPEQIELVKQYILYGIKSLPVSERVKLFMLDNLNAIMWLLAAIAAIVFAITNRLTSKKHTDEAQYMEDKANEAEERSIKNLAAAEENMEAMRDACVAAVCETLAVAKKHIDSNSEESKRYVDGVMEFAKGIADNANAALRENSDRESAMTEALLLSSEITAYLIENSSLPEVERDRMTAIANRIAEKIAEAQKPKEVSGNDEA
jgi:hypothetical protein